MKTAAAAPLNTDSFVDPTNWANEIAIGEVSRPGFDPLRASLPAEVFEQGNLSALEDAEPLSPSRPPHPPPAVAPYPSSAPGSLPPSASSPPGSLPSAQRSGPNSSARSSTNPKGASGPGGAAIGVVVLLLVAAAGAAAWFTHLIPHH
jgi:hypothetical protein